MRGVQLSVPVKKMGIPYRPDAPLGYGEEHIHCSVMAVGINPGWDDEAYKKDWKEQIYSEPDIEKYKDRFASMWKKLKEEKKIGRQPYRDSIYYTFEKINEELRIYEAKIEKERIFDYVFWANLSFCSSQKVDKRVIGGKEFEGWNVFNEEIPNCLDKGYLRRIIEAIEPKLIMFLGADLEKYFEKIFNIANRDEILYFPRRRFPAHKRGDKTVETTIIACKLKIGEKDTSVLFLPHPNYRFKKEYKKAALEEVCKWLKITG